MAQLLLLERPFSPAFVSELGALVRGVFGEFDVGDLVADLAWRLAEMPAASLQAAMADGRLVALKP